MNGRENLIDPEKAISNDSHRKPKKVIKHTRASEITPEAIEWLWPSIFALGKYSLLAGEGGLGKSQLAIFIAAAVSTQMCWPHTEVPAQKGSTIILSAEDDPSTTIVPRLIAAGANLDLIYIINAVEIKSTNAPTSERIFDLTADIDALETMIYTLNDVTLVIIDPISAYLGNTNTYNNSEVRKVLAPLTKLAEKNNVAVICITHLTKNKEGSPKSRVTDSIAFLNTSRSSFLISEDPNDSNKKLFLELKNNLAHSMVGYKFVIEEYEIKESAIKTSRVKWLVEKTDLTATQALASLQLKPKASSALKEAVDFLTIELSNGPVKSSTIFSIATEAGIAKGTLRRAKETLDVQSKKYQPEDSSAYWVWSLPNKNNFNNKIDHQSFTP